MEFNPRICITGSFTLINFARLLRLSLPMDGMKHSIARDPVDRSSTPRRAPKIDPPGLRRLRFSFHKPHCQRAGTSSNSQDQTSGLRSEKKNHTRFPCWALPSIRNCCRPVGWKTLSCGRPQWPPPCFASQRGCLNNNPVSVSTTFHEFFATTPFFFAAAA